MSATAQVISESNIKDFHKRKGMEDELKKKRVIRNKFLRDQILKRNRMDLLMKEVLGYQVEDFHQLMFTHREKCYWSIGDQQWHLALAPRGGGKTTIMTISSVIMDILQNPNIRILIASKTDSNAVEMLSEIKKKLTSKKLVDIFGPQVGDIWNDGEVNVVGRAEDADKGKTVTTVGVGSALASRHFDKIYADDLVDDTNSITDVQREKIYNWFFKILDPTLVPSGMMSLIGTRYHFSDLYGILIDQMFTKKNKKGEVTKKYYIRIPALIRKKDWKKYKKRIDRYVSFWPQRFSVKFLLKKRKNQGTIIFNSQYQNDVEAMKGKIFKYEWFNWVTPDEVPVHELKIFQGVDLAIKQSDKADKFAHCTIGVHPKTKNIYVLNYYNAVTHYTKQKKILKEKFNTYDPIRVGIEANGYQLALLQDMRDNPDLAHIRAFPVYTETDKTVRAWKLSAYFERSQVFLMEGMNEMQEHLLKMPDGRYKDLFDALDIAVSMAFRSTRKVREIEPGII